jgi:hypothetical protein
MFSVIGHSVNGEWLVDIAGFERFNARRHNLMDPALPNKKAVLPTDSPLGWQTISYAPGTAIRAWQGIAMGIIMEMENVGVFIRLSLLCTAPSCKL